MAAITTTEQITVNVLTSDGNGFWYLTLDTDKIIGLNFTNSVLRTAWPARHANTLNDLLILIKSENLKADISRLSVNIDDSAELHQLNAQLDAVDLNRVTTDFGVNGLVIILQVLGSLRLVRRALQESIINLSHLQTIFFFYLDKNTFNRNQIQDALEWLKTNSFINQAQIDGFWNNYNNK